MAAPYVTIVLPGAPKGKGRPRFTTIGGFARAYTEKKTVTYENALKAAGVAAMNGLQTLNEAIGISVVGYLPVPDSWSRAKRAAALAGDIMPTGKPDADNIGKMLDGLNYHPPAFKGDKEKRPIIWRDDAQIVSLHIMKFYGADPRLVVQVFRWFAAQSHG